MKRGKAKKKKMSARKSVFIERCTAVGHFSEVEFAEGYNHPPPRVLPIGPYTYVSSRAQSNYLCVTCKLWNCRRKPALSTSLYHQLYHLRTLSKISYPNCPLYPKLLPLDDSTPDIFDEFVKVTFLQYLLNTLHRIIEPGGEGRD